MEEGIQWGRSRLGCDGCNDPRALAGFVVTVGSQAVYHLCTSCAATWTPGWSPQRARAQAAEPQKQMAL